MVRKTYHVYAIRGPMKVGNYRVYPKADLGRIHSLNFFRASAISVGQPFEGIY